MSKFKLLVKGKQKCPNCKKFELVKVTNKDWSGFKVNPCIPKKNVYSCNSCNSIYLKGDD